MSYKKTTLKLSVSGLLALKWWLQHVIGEAMNEHNHYARLFALVIARMYQKKVYPSTGMMKKETRFQLNEEQTLALTISFAKYDYCDAPIDIQAQLFYIAGMLPKKGYIRPEYYIPPNIEA